MAIDIGNSATKFGVFDGERLSKRFTAPTIRGKSANEIWESIEEEVDFQVDLVVISSVVVELIDAFTDLSENHFNTTPLIVDASFDFGLKIAYDPPSNAGTARSLASCRRTR
ncbi:MAG TPA: type III pantothenate kinase, partial [Pyrinomonadaceae bacterium]|nr:type III pantothenate kinase [Pyrinomonadaceae bacterium]